MKKHIVQQVKSINKAFRTFSLRKSNLLLENLTDTIKQGNKIIASGLGKNAPICEKFIGTLNSVGINSCFLHTHTAIHGDIGMVREGDLIIMLSKSGETEETIRLAKLLKKRNINMWLLTCTKNCSAGKHFNNVISLPIDKEGDPWDLIPNNSTIIFLIYLNALALSIIENLKIPISVFKQNHPGGGIGKRLKHV